MTDPTPEQIEAAAKAMFEAMSGYFSEGSLRHLARVALAAAAVASPGVGEKARELAIVNDWLVESVGEHTCGTGPEGHYGAHEPGCGYVPLVNLAELDGYPAQVDEAKLVAFLESETHAPQRTHSPVDGSCQECPWQVVMLPTADLARELAAWVRGGGR